ncbi:MAG: aspartate/glutamate racemase family protein [Spirochaetota bacterium]
MIYRVKNEQVSYGEAIGIILLENYVPFIPGDVANATTYSYPVRFQRVEGFSVERIFRHDMSLLGPIIEAAKSLEREGVRAITGDCGFMVIYQEQMAEKLSVPVFMSSLLQIPFMIRLLAEKDKIGVITASSESLDDLVLKKAGVQEPERLVITGLENKQHFKRAVIEEKGVLDTEKMENEVVSASTEMIKKHPLVRMILLECSLLPPYGAAVQDAVNLPVFDFITMIDFVFSAVVKKRYNGFM